MTKKHSTLLGLAIGDALGQPFEFSSTLNIIKSGWDGGMQYGDVWKLKAGQWTDDTKMALCIAESLLERRKFDSTDLGQKYIAWVKTGDTRGIGATCHQSISKIERGMPVKKITSPFQSNFLQLKQIYEDDSDLYGIGDFCGNGTVMRCAPIGLFFHNDEEARNQAAIADATMTHDHADARDSSKFLCSVIADLANDWDIRGAIDNAMAKEYEYDHVPRLVRKAIDLADDSNSNFAHAIELGNSGTAHGTLATAVYSCLKYTSFKEAVTASVLIGGDTDTRAAVVGAIAGTAYGLRGIPAEWVEVLEDSDRLQEIDTRLYESG